jgi:PilZ domain-containing protein
MGSFKERRQLDRFPVQWPMLYANEELIGQGTLMNLSHGGCQVAGTMPVAVGMLLKVWVSPGHREEALFVKEARVLWAREHEFGLELRHVQRSDHQWLMGFLENAERRHSFQAFQSSSQEDLPAIPLALPLKD